MMVVWSKSYHSRRNGQETEEGKVTIEGKAWPWVGKLGSSLWKQPREGELIQIKKAGGLVSNGGLAVGDQTHARK